MTQDDLSRIVESASRVGLELDSAEAERWMNAMESGQGGDEITLDHRTGVFGHRIVMLDFSADDLAFFRSVGALVEIPDEDDVETALALSGSAAQSKIQAYPGDCDYFERVNIKAPTREEACRRTAEVIRKKALDRMEGYTYRFIEAKFGNYPVAVNRAGSMIAAGSPIAWSADEVEAGEIVAETPEGEEITIRWMDVASEPGWCKLDWVVADPVRKL